MSTALAVRETKFQKIRKRVAKRAARATANAVRRTEQVFGTYLDACCATARVIHRVPRRMSAPQNRQRQSPVRPIQYGGALLHVPPLT